MSAFVVDKVHIDALVTAGLSMRNPDRLRWQSRDLTPEESAESFEPGQPWGPAAIENYRKTMCELTHESAERTGAMLWAENVRSVNHRYAEDELEEVYTFDLLPGSVSPVVVLKALSCYEYQSCEHPGWAGSEAKHFCDALRQAMINRLPGMDSAPWEITDRYVFGGKPINMLRAEREAV